MKYCFDCEWCDNDKKADWDKYGIYYCYHKKINPVTGDSNGVGQECSEERKSMSPNDCGPDARYFKEKEG